MSGGAAAGDIDGDGSVDLFVTRLDAPDILFRNRGDGTFEDISDGMGLDKFNFQSNGVLLVDIDNDGDRDIYVTVLGAALDPINNRNCLYVNQGEDPFTEEAILRGVDIHSDQNHFTYSVSAGDFDRDGWIDLHVNEWVPSLPSHSRLLRNRGLEAPGFFEDVTTAAGVDLTDVHAFASTFTDLDQDGWPDLAVVADFGSSRLFWNNGDGTFTDGTEAAGVGTDENGMGSAFGRL